MTVTACDWDHESFCAYEHCDQPATHSYAYALTDDGTPVVELLCCYHATAVQQ